MVRSVSGKTSGSTVAATGPGGRPAPTYLYPELASATRQPHRYRPASGQAATAPSTPGAAESGVLTLTSRRDQLSTINDASTHGLTALTATALALAPVRQEPHHIDPERTPTAALPCPEGFTRRIMQAILDVCAARRPAGQVLRHLEVSVQHAVKRRSALAHRLHRARGTLVLPARVLSVAICHPADGVVEASLTFTADRRARAAALRLEGINGKWRVTALTMA